MIINDDKGVTHAVLGQGDVAAVFYHNEGAAVIALQQLEVAVGTGNKPIEGINPDNFEVVLHFTSLESIEVVQRWLETAKKRYIKHCQEENQ